MIAQYWSNQNTRWKRILSSKSQSYKPLNYIGYCEKSIDFPQKIAAKELNFCKLRIAHFKQAKS